MSTRAMTVRFDERQAEALEQVANIDQVPVAEAVRKAVESHIDARRQDPEFRERLKASLERNREILERLAVM